MVEENPKRTMTEKTGTERSPSRRSRVLGSFLGGAVGDALGAPVEFMGLSQIQSIIGPNGVDGYWNRAANPGLITDDTQMTLFTAEGLIRIQQRIDSRGIPSHREVLWSAYLRWLDTQDEQPPGPGDFHTERGFLVDVPELRHRRAPGMTCLSALRSGRLGKVDRPLNDSKGCGGVMRVAPVAFAVTEPFEVGCDAAAITHSHPSGYLAAGAFAQILGDVYDGNDLRNAIDGVIDKLASIEDADEVRVALRSALRVSEKGASSHNVELLGQGWVAEEALAISVYCALVAEDFRHGVLLAVNHSGDSDSTGSMTGQILGTLHGVEAIPTGWIDGLREREIVERVANDVAARYIDDVILDFDDYPPN